MEKIDVSALHDRIYTHLREKYPNLKFRLRQDIPRNKQKLLDGYWFWGDEKTLQLSFWRGSDGLHMTYMMGWWWWFGDSKATVFFVGRQSDIRAKQFDLATAELEKTLDLKFIKDKDKAVWQAEMTSSDPIIALDDFIEQIYPKINDYFQNKLDDFDAKTGGIKHIDLEISDKYFDKSTTKIDEYREEYQRQREKSKNVKTKADVNLPYALQRIRVSNFQGIKNLEKSNLPTNAQWIFITGENGFGKTSLLKAIATGLVGNDRLFFMGDIQIAFLNGNNERITHQVYNPMELGEEDIEDELKDDTKVLIEENLGMVSPSTKTCPPIAMYGVTRISNKYSTILPSSVTQSLFDNEAIFYDIQNEMKIIEKRDDSRFKILNDAFITLLPNIEDIKIDERGENVFFKEKDNAEYITLDKLGAGLQGTINLVGDIIKRLESSPKNKAAKELTDLGGIVLIDEIDANLHPTYQYELPQLLSKVFPKVQFIAITHSPIPLLGVMKLKPVVLTVTRDLEKGIQVERWDDKIDLDVLMPNAVLSSPIFNFETLFSTAFDEKKQRIRTEDYYNDVVYHNRLQKDLNDLSHSKREDELLDFLKSKNN